MKKIIFASFLPLLLVFALAVQAATIVSVRIETPDKTLFNKQMSVPDGCTVKDKTGKEHQISGAKVICALEAAAKEGGLSYELESSSFGLFLDKINTYDGNATSFWLYRVNDKLASVGVADYTVASNDRVLFSFGSDPLLPLKVEVDKTSLKANENLTVTSLVWDNDKGNFTALDGVFVFLDGVRYTTGSDSKVIIHQPKAGNYSVYAEKTNYVRSEKVSVQVSQAPTPTPTATVTPTPSLTSTPTPTPSPTPTPKVAGTTDNNLPTTGPGEIYFLAMLSLLIGVYLKGKRLIHI